MDTKVQPSQEHAEYVAPSGKRGVLNTLYPPGPQPGAKGRMKNHCRKFWWCDCLVFIIILLVIVLPIIFVGIPKIAQHQINASTLEVQSEAVTSPTPEGIHLKIQTVVTSSSKYHPVIEPFRAGLSLKGQSPFLYLDIPKSKSEAITYISIDESVKFASKDGFSKYTQAVLNSETLQFNLDGKAKLKLSGLPKMNVNYNKVITMKGLNKLAGLNITDVKILSGKDSVLPDGSNLVGNVHIPNPSVMTIDLGNLTMNLGLDGKPVGTSLIPNVLLKPGQNTFPMQSTVDQLTILGLIQSKYKNAVIPLEITGNSSINSNGEHLAYYEAATKANTIHIDLNIAPALAAIGINITSSSH